MVRPCVRLTLGSQTRLLQLLDAEDFGSIEAFLERQLGAKMAALRYQINNDDHCIISSAAHLHQAISHHMSLGRTQPIELHACTELLEVQSRPSRGTAGVFLGHRDSLELVHDVSRDGPLSCSRRPPSQRHSQPSPLPINNDALTCIAEGRKPMDALKRLQLDGLVLILCSRPPREQQFLLNTVLATLSREKILKNFNGNMQLSRREIAALLTNELLKGKLSSVLRRTESFDEARSRTLCILNFLSRVIRSEPAGAISIERLELNNENVVTQSYLNDCSLPVLLPILRAFGSVEACREQTELWWCHSVPGLEFGNLRSQLHSDLPCVRPELLVLVPLCPNGLGARQALRVRGTKRYHVCMDTQRHYLEVDDNDTDHQVLCVDVCGYVDAVDGEQTLNVPDAIVLLNKYLSAMVACTPDTELACTLPPGRNVELQCTLLILAASLARCRLVLYR